MKVLILGSGAREHALTLAIAKSPQLERLYVAPGNPGCAEAATLVSLNIVNSAEIVEFCKANAIDLVVVGPEAPLVAGDRRRSRRRRHRLLRARAARPRNSRARKASPRISAANSAFRPATTAASLPRARRSTISRAKGAPIVVKADGLAAGKGVVVATTLDEAEAAVNSHVRRRVRRRRRRSRRRGIPGRRGGFVFRALRWRRARSPLAAHRTTSASAMAIRARTPAAWAPIRRRP